MQESSITLVGNLTADPQLRVIPSGASVCSFRMGCTPRWRNRETGTWQDGQSTFYSVSAWRGLADNIAASLHRGDRVIVIGRLRQRTYTTATGEERLVVEVDADTVAPDLNRHEAIVRKAAREQAPAAQDQPAPGPGAEVAA